MKYLLSIAASVSAALLGLCVSPAQAQQEHINARARHKGTYNFFRTEPNRHSHIIEKMPQGTPFVITGESGNYYSIVLADGRTGWTARVNALIEGQNPSADTDGEDGEDGRAAAPVVAVRGAPVAPVVVEKSREGVVPVVKPVAETAAPPPVVVTSPPAVAHTVSLAPHRAPHVSKHTTSKVKPHVVKAHAPRTIQPVP